MEKHFSPQEMLPCVQIHPLEFGKLRKGLDLKLSKNVCSLRVEGRALEKLRLVSFVHHTYLKVLTKGEAGGYKMDKIRLT